jgi:phage shock protein E
MQRADHLGVPGVGHRGSLARALLLAALGCGLAVGCATTVNYADPDSLRRLVEDGTRPYTLVDVRTPAEFSRDHIPTAINIPVETISASRPGGERDDLVIVYCSSGARSTSAARRLRALGYTNVVNFGSISRWKSPLIAGPN